MDNRDYARVLEEIASLMQIKGANQFRVRAFENAARTIESTAESIEARIDSGDVTELKGIGDGIASQLRQIRQRGTCDDHQRLIDELDEGLLDLLDIQGLGPKRIQKIYEQLGITDLDELRKAAEDGRIASLSGFGAKTQQTIIDEIERLADRAGRIPLPRADAIARSIRDQLVDIDGVDTIEVAGSLRRQQETIGDVDLLVATDDPEPIHRRLAELVEVADVLVTGETKTSVRLQNGVQVDVRTVEPGVFGSALHYFTGSKEHHVELRTRAKQRGLKINEYGVFQIDADSPIASRSEQQLYEALDLDFIPPELRQGRDEIAAAEHGELPTLVDADQLRGDLHMHTTETDGRASIEEMARAGASRGYEYIAITDHSRAVRVADGMTADRFADQIDEVRRVDDRLDDIRILSGIEVDILDDGTLDMDHELLARCDWVVASIHSQFNQDSDVMTRRILDAIDTGLISCLGHPTGRILGGRDGYSYDFDAVVDAAADADVALELNGSSGRLDLNAALARRAHQRGAALVIGSDAHSTNGLDAIRFGVGQARRAGLEAPSIGNCQSADELLASVGKRGQ